MNLEFPVNWPHDHYENAQIKKSFFKKTNRKREREKERQRDREGHRDREKRERREREREFLQ